MVQVVPSSLRVALRGLSESTANALVSATSFKACIREQLKWLIINTICSV